MPNAGFRLRASLTLRVCFPRRYPVKIVLIVTAIQSNYPEVSRIVDACAHRSLARHNQESRGYEWDKILLKFDKLELDLTPIAGVEGDKS